MGCRTSCKIFEEFSTVIEWIAQNKLVIAHVVHILDDFLFIENTKQSVLNKYKQFLDVCADLGNPLAAERNTIAQRQSGEMSKFIVSISKQESMHVERNPILGRGS